MPGLRVHHLNCATLCPPFADRFLNDAGVMVCHCLLVETPAAGLVLVDTGLGLRDLAQPSRSGAFFHTMTRPRLDPAECALMQVRRLGFKAEDVRHIVVTHLDVDHCGGLADFPEATVHVHEPELDAALRPLTRTERQRYRGVLWAHGPTWSKYRGPVGEPFFGFEAVRELAGLPPEILLVPLVGHTRGHSGVAVRGLGGWMLHAGDAYMHEAEIDPRGDGGPLMIELFQAAEEHDGRARARNRRRLAALRRDRAAEVTVFSAHDPAEYARAQAQAAAGAAAGVR